METRRSRPRVAGGVALLAAAVFGLAGCTASGSSSDGSAGGSAGDSGFSDGSELPATGDIGSESGADPGTADGPASAVPNPAPTDGDTRSLISEGYVFITADDPIDAADEATRLVEAAGGRVDSRSEQPGTTPSTDGKADAAAVATDQVAVYPGIEPSMPGSGPSAQLTVRIPTDALTATLDDIEALGEVEQVSISATDVTAQVQDLDARISALSTSVDRLLELMADATTTTDLIAIESALSTRQADLESLQAQQRSLGDRVDLATLQVSFGSVADAPVDEPQNFLSGLVSGWNALVGFLGAALIGIGVVLPWLAVAAALAVLVLLVGRALRARAATRSAAAAGGDTNTDAG